MSKNITIKEDMISEDFDGIETVETKTIGLLSADWMPEDETTLTDIEIIENGHYTANELGYYGFRKVKVSVSNNYIVGTSDDGNDYIISTDDEGYIDKSKLPMAIKITTPPTITAYNQYAEINLNGMVVVTKDKDGETMETLNNSDLVLSKLRADKPGPVYVYYTREDGKPLNDYFNISIIL